MLTGNFTEQGKALLDKGAAITFTRMQIGETGKLHNLKITNLKKQDDKAYLDAILDLSSVKQGFFWKECGLYAMDPQVGEILYCYAMSSQPDYIAPSDSGMMEEIMVSMVATVGSNTNVNISIDSSMVFTSKKEFDPLKHKVDDLCISVKEFGAVGDGVTDDSDAIIRGITYINRHRRTLYFPNGTYLVGKTIDMSNFSFDEGEGVDWKYTLSFLGEDVRQTVLKAKAGVEKMFVYGKDRKISRTFKFKNFKVLSEEPNDAYLIRGNLKAFELLYCPYTEFENIDITGIDFGIHLGACWLSKLKNVYINRVNKGIFLDGTNVNDPHLGGWADHCYLENIAVGSSPNDFGIKMYSSTGTKVINFNSESGGSGPAILLESCHNVDLDTLYFENFVDGSPIYIKGKEPLNSISDWSTNIVVSNGKFYNNLGVAAIVFGKGVDGIQVKDSRFSFNYDSLEWNEKPVTNQAIQTFGFASPLDENFGLYFRNIDYSCNNSFYTEEGLGYMGGYSTSFRFGQRIYLKGTNFAYYKPTLEKGMTIIPIGNAYSDFFSIDIKEGGTSATLSDSTITGVIEPNSNIATLSDISHIVTNTYITIGSVQRLKVLAKHIDSKRIVVDRTLENGASGNVSYCKPVLEYNYKAQWGTTSSEPVFQSNMVRGQYYFDNDLKMPRFYDGNEFYPVVQSGYGTTGAVGENTTILPSKSLPPSKTFNVVVTARGQGNLVNVVSSNSTSFTVVSNQEDVNFYWIATVSTQ